MRYSDTIRIPGEVPVENVEHAVEMIRGHGSADLLVSPIRIRFELSDIHEDGTSEGDLDAWDLRDMLDDIATELASWGIDYDPDKERMQAP